MLSVRNYDKKIVLQKLLFYACHNNIHFFELKFRVFYFIIFTNTDHRKPFTSALLCVIVHYLGLL